MTSAWPHSAQITSSSQLYKRFVTVSTNTVIFLIRVECTCHLLLYCGFIQKLHIAQVKEAIATFCREKQLASFNNNGWVSLLECPIWHGSSVQLQILKTLVTTLPVLD